MPGPAMKKVLTGPPIELGMTGIVDQDIVAVAGEDGGDNAGSRLCLITIITALQDGVEVIGVVATDRRLAQSLAVGAMPPAVPASKGDPGAVGYVEIGRNRPLASECHDVGCLGPEEAQGSESEDFRWARSRTRNGDRWDAHGAGGYEEYGEARQDQKPSHFHSLSPQQHSSIIAAPELPALDEKQSRCARYCVDDVAGEREDRPGRTSGQRPSRPSRGREAANPQGR